MNKNYLILEDSLNLAFARRLELKMSSEDLNHLIENYSTLVKMAEFALGGNGRKVIRNLIESSAFSFSDFRNLVLFQFCEENNILASFSLSTVVASCLLRNAALGLKHAVIR